MALLGAVNRGRRSLRRDQASCAAALMDGLDPDRGQAEIPLNAAKCDLDAGGSTPALTAQAGQAGAVDVQELDDPDGAEGPLAGPTQAAAVALPIAGVLGAAIALREQAQHVRGEPRVVQRLIRGKQLQR